MKKSVSTNAGKPSSCPLGLLRRVLYYLTLPCVILFRHLFIRFWQYIRYLQFPKGEGFLKCEKCGYKTHFFNHGGDNRQVFYCRTCADIVNPEVVPFLFVPPPCNRCETQLLREDRIHTDHLSGDDRIECPKCHRTSLVLENVCEIFFNDDYENGKIPKVGETIHGIFFHPDDESMSPFIFISPWIPQRLRMNATLTKGKMADLPNGYYEFEVKNVGEEILLLEYRGELPKSVWSGYFRPATEPEPEPPKSQPLPSVECPRCGKPLRTAKAEQCFHCGADWHQSQE